MFYPSGFPRTSRSSWTERLPGKTAAAAEDVVLVYDYVLSLCGVASTGSPRTARFPRTPWTASKHQNSWTYFDSRCSAGFNQKSGQNLHQKNLEKISIDASLILVKDLKLTWVQVLLGLIALLLVICQSFPELQKIVKLLLLRDSQDMKEPLASQDSQDATGQR